MSMEHVRGSRQVAFAFETLTVSDRGVRWGLVHELLTASPG